MCIRDRPPSQAPLHFVLKVVTGVDGRKCDWQHSMAHPRKPPFRRTNLTDISYTDRVIAFLSKISLPWQWGSAGEKAISSIRWRITKNLPIGAKISYASRVKASFVQLWLPWQQGSVREKCKWQHSMANPQKIPYGRKNLAKISYAS